MYKILFTSISLVLLIFEISFSQITYEQAKKLSYPLCYISVPFQNNFDFNIKPNNGFRETMNLMPVIPFEINKNINIINRIVVPVITQNDIFKGKSQTGIGDVLINTFFSPSGAEYSWGIGPSFYIPSGFPVELTSKKWGTGPGIIAAKTAGKFMLGLLYFHLWSFAGNEDRPDFSFSYIQPVAIYNFKNGWGAGFTAEISNEFKKKVSTGALIFTGSKLINIEGQLINLVLGPKYYFGNFNKPEFGIRAIINFLFP